MTGAAVGLVAAGITEDDFIPAAPLAACRLCGAIYQTKLHRDLYRSRQMGYVDPPSLLMKVVDLGTKWRENHAKKVHTAAEIEEFTRTGWAFTPEAAKVLAPFGIIPLGIMHPEIEDAMFIADRKPDLTKLEGGE